MADNFAVSPGTGVTIRTDDVGGIQYPVVKLDVGADGLSVPFTGTLGAVTNLAGGSVIVTGGTINTGTVFAKTLGTEVNPANEWTAISTGTGTATGTVKAAVAGSVIYVTGLVISGGTNATQIGVSSGTPTIAILGTMSFAANGGLALTPINPPLRTTSGSALVWSQNGTSNVSITAVGYVE